MSPLNLKNMQENADEFKKMNETLHLNCVVGC